MKTRFYLVMAMIALSWMGCSQEEDAVNQMQMNGGKTINATIESITRSTVTDAGVFSWASGDAISVHDASSSDIYSYSGSGNGFTLPGKQTVTEPTVAYYPANESHTDDAFYLPDVYGSEGAEYVASTNAAMIATPPTEGNTYAFMHLGGVMRFNVKNVPTNANGFQFTAVGKNITGRFDFVDGDVKTIATSDGSNSTVSIWFKASDEVRDMTFYVPMPVGIYGKYTVGLRIGDNFITHTSESVSNTISRKTLLLMPTFTFDGTTLVKGSAKVGVIDLEDGNKSADISASADIVVTPGDADATATLNYTPATDGSSELSLSDGTNSATSAESEGQVVVATSEDATIASCDINTPSLTVELSAAEGTSVVYNKVTALTAQQTLVIGEGVTIKKLVLMGGNVVLKGNVESIESEVPTTITLDKDITLEKSMTFSKGNVTVDLNNKSIKCALSDVFVVTNGTLTIDGEGLVYGSETDEGNSCAVWVNGANAKAIIKNGTYKVGGDINGTTDKRNDCIYVGSDGGTIEIYGGVFEYTGKVKDGSINDGSRFLVNQNNKHTTQLITIYGGTFHNFDPANAKTDEPWMTDGIGSFVAPGYSSVAGENGTYVVDEGILNETALKAAIAAGKTEVTLGEHITLTDAITIDKDITLDLGGNTLSMVDNNLGKGNYAVVLVKKGNVVIKNGTIATAGTANHMKFGAVWAYGSEQATVTIKEGTTLKGNNWKTTALDGQNSCIATVYVSNPNCTITIEGGEFYCVQQEQPAGQNQILNIKEDNGNLKGNIVVKGGKFYGMDPAIGNGKLDGSYVAAGYSSVAGENGTYVVQKGIFNETALNAAIVNGAEITLNANMTIAKAITIPTGITATINLNGFNVTAPNTDAFEVQGILTINGTNGTEESVVSAGTANPSGGVCAVWAHNGGKVTINGGYYKVYKDAEGKRNDCIYAGSNSKETAGSIVINGGKFEYASERNTSSVHYNGDLFLLNCANSQPTSKITVNAGSFKNHVPSKESNGTENEVVLGEGKKVYNGETEVTAAHNGTTDIWYVVK